MKPILLALVGPTGVGKTQVSLDVASALNAEILSMDSMQIYRGMDIGTAKSSFEERRGIAHHMIDVADPSERFTVADYRDQTIPIIDDILSRGKQPMLVGGTGLYLDAIRYDMTLGRKGADEAIRLRLRKIAEEPDGQLRLHEMLRAVDPQTAEKLHPNDVRRVMRALEIYETSGKTKSEQADSARAEGKYHVLVYGLSQPREIMYARINARVDEMMEACDSEWRGLGVIPASGMKLRPEWQEFDARIKYQMPKIEGRPNPACRCGDVLQGKCKPSDCKVFGKGCTPQHPIGACMVSGEGACSAYYQYS